MNIKFSHAHTVQSITQSIIHSNAPCVSFLCYVRYILSCSFSHCLSVHSYKQTVNTAKRRQLEAYNVKTLSLVQDGCKEKDGCFN